MALTVADATAMLDAAEQNGVKLYVAENETYAASTHFLRNVVQTGELIGELVAATMVKGFRAENFGYPGRRAWLTQLEQGGTGTWMLHGIHSMAQLRHIFGEVETVYLREHKSDSYARRDLEGTMSGLLTMASGLHIPIIQTSEAKLFHNLGGYVLHGSQGSLRATADTFELFTADHPEPTSQSYPEQPLSSYAQEMAAFADYVTGVATGPTTGYSERRSLAIVEAGYQSARLGQPVDLSTMIPGDDNV
jgi:predicted dehydrogenase